VTESDRKYALRYQRVPNILEAPNGSILLPDRTGHVFQPTPTQKSFLQLCSSFRPLSELRKHLSFSDSDVNALVSAGFVETDQSVIRTCLLQSKNSTLPKIEDLGILTCASPHTLRRAGASWSKSAAHHGRNLRLIITDDSSNEEDAAKQRTVAKDIANSSGSDVRFIDPGVRQKLAKSLARSAGVDMEIVEFALSGRDHPRIGIGCSRNLLALLTRGRRYLSADDDVIAEFAAPDVTEQWAFITSGDVPLETEFFDSIEELTSKIDMSCEPNPFEMHEMFVGRSVADILADFDGCASLTNVNASLTQALNDGTARVAATALGLVGDAASHCMAFFCLLATGKVRRQLMTRQDPMSTSREVFRSIPTAVFAQGATLMTFCHAVDNIHDIPPYFPIGRGEDQVWQKLLHWSDPGTVVGNLPLSVAHRPASQRFFSREDYTDPCGDFPGNAFLLGAIDSCPIPYIGFNPDERLDWLGGYLAGASNNGPKFSSLVTQAWRSYLNHHLLQVETSLNRHSDSPEWWQQTMQEIQERLKDQLNSASPVPVEHASLDGDEAIEALRLDVIKFSHLLQVWPSIRKAGDEFSERILNDGEWLKP
jgi:hypothetical protein